MSRIEKSKERVKKFAEVFTPIHIVKKMIDMIDVEDDGTDPYELGKTWLEPACGNGVFIGEIVQRKISRYDNAHDTLDALRDVYAVDIQPDNIQQCQCQAVGQVIAHWFRNNIQFDDVHLNRLFEIMEKNYIVGDFLKPETIQFYDWKKCEYVCMKDMLPPEEKTKKRTRNTRPL